MYLIHIFLDAIVASARKKECNKRARNRTEKRGTQTQRQTRGEEDAERKQMVTRHAESCFCRGRFVIFLWSFSSIPDYASCRAMPVTIRAILFTSVCGNETIPTLVGSYARRVSKKAPRIEIPPGLLYCI